MPVRPSLKMFFNYLDQGWSERWWWTSAVPSGGLPGIQTSAEALMNLRVKLLGHKVTVPWAYLSYDDVRRDAFMLNLPFPNENGVWNTAFGDFDDENAYADQANACIIVRMASGDRSTKMWYCAGVPDYVVAVPPRQPPILPDEWMVAYRAFRDFLKTNWGWKGVAQDAGLATAINGITADGENWDIAVTAVGLIKPGWLVKVSDATFFGPQGNTRGNRVYTVTAVTALTNVIRVSWGGIDMGGLTYVGGGTLTPLTTNMYPVTATQVRKIGTRKRGVGFGKPVGRRKRR